MLFRFICLILSFGHITSAFANETASATASTEPKPLELGIQSRNFGVLPKHALAIGGGAYNISREDETTSEVRVEYRYLERFWLFRPFAGAMFALDRAFYAFGGVGIDLYIQNRLVFTPNFAAGFYKKGYKQDLGFPIEFRSGMTLSYRFTNQVNRLELSYSHMSNAKLGERNPGQESVTLSFVFPISLLSPEEQAIQQYALK